MRFHISTYCNKNWSSDKARNFSRITKPEGGRLCSMVCDSTSQICLSGENLPERSSVSLRYNRELSPSLSNFLAIFFPSTIVVCKVQRGLKPRSSNSMAWKHWGSRMLGIREDKQPIMLFDFLSPYTSHWKEPITQTISVLRTLLHDLGQRSGVKQSVRTTDPKVGPPFPLSTLNALPTFFTS